MSNALDAALEKALESRVKRKILRRLPAPSSPSQSTESHIDFTSNDYLSLSSSRHLHKHLLETLQKSPDILGSGGSRLLVNPKTHAALESRLTAFFRHTPGGTLLFNSGFDANVALFSSLPQPGDVLVYDEYIHASVHDGMRSGCRAKGRIKFKNNDIDDLKCVLETLVESDSLLKTGASSLFLAVESLYSMDGTFAPLKPMIHLLEELFPLGNAYMIVDEAHSTGLYGPQGRGRVALEGLEGHPRILARLCTFGKALAATGAVLLTTPLVASYLINYARPLIYTTALSHLAIIAASCSFDMLEDGTAARLAEGVLGTSRWFVGRLKMRLKEEGIPEHILIVGVNNANEELSSFSPIIPLLTSPVSAPPSFSPAHDLSAHLLVKHRVLARPITWPTVPKGQDRVRVCLHAGHTKEQVGKLIEGAVEWAKARVATKKLELVSGPVIPQIGLMKSRL
ncbi:8-amino-7-oxononanoate synthase [Moniliophthora roreri]|uniref:Aminotransferase class I/classII large domain-containing protein n=1 Tax=Moniliophthora roreri TaxID=221103 RepID=A0A0W0G7W4_MONRR|nr:8-amino-7-oxononanoate synthase [Moniliophthora roreri]